MNFSVILLAEMGMYICLFPPQHDWLMKNGNHITEPIRSLWWYVVNWSDTSYKSTQRIQQSSYGLSSPAIHQTYRMVQSLPLVHETSKTHLKRYLSADYLILINFRAYYFAKIRRLHFASIYFRNSRKKLST